MSRVKWVNSYLQNDCYCSLTFGKGKGRSLDFRFIATVQLNYVNAEVRSSLHTNYSKLNFNFFSVFSAKLTQ